MKNGRVILLLLGLALLCFGVVLTVVVNVRSALPIPTMVAVGSPPGDSAARTLESEVAVPSHVDLDVPRRRVEVVIPGPPEVYRGKPNPASQHRPDDWLGAYPPETREQLVAIEERIVADYDLVAGGRGDPDLQLVLDMIDKLEPPDSAGAELARVDALSSTHYLSRRPLEAQRLLERLAIRADLSDWERASVSVNIIYRMLEHPHWFPEREIGALVAADVAAEPWAEEFHRLRYYYGGTAAARGTSLLALASIRGVAVDAEAKSFLDCAVAYPDAAVEGTFDLPSLESAFLRCCSELERGPISLVVRGIDPLPVRRGAAVP